MTENNKQNSGIPQGQQVTMGETMDAPMMMGNNWKPPSERYIKSIFNEFFAKKEQAIADLEVYLENPVGVGEHSDISEEIKKKIKEIDKYSSLVDTVKDHFMANNNSEDQAP